MRTCPKCGFENADSAKFCSECGTPLAKAPAAPREERKVVSVVFADLVGSTARAERLDPEDVRAILAPYHDRLRHELERHGGTVEKFIGDAVVGVFGAPVAHEDDAERAVRAALAIQEAIAELNEAQPALELEVRIGVHTGEALVSVGARPELGEAMVAGDVMNTGARLQAGAPPGGVLVGGATHRATERAIEYHEAEPLTAKGKQEPLRVWLATGRRSGFGVDIGGAGRAALVGRERELDVLADALGRARAGRDPQLVTLVGVPGIGKSRLVYELYRLVDEDPELITWRQGRSLPYGEGVVLWALGEMVKGQAGILESDSPGDASEKLTLAVRDLIADEAEAAWVARNLLPLVGLSGGDATDAEHDETPAAWRRFAEALADSRPTVLVFEDLHWADDGLLDFVDELVDWVRDVPLLVVGTARPELLERRPGWGGGKRNATTISLTPLDDVNTARLVAALLERSLLPAETQAALLARAGGNPLYAEEFARMHALGQDGEGGVPDTLQAIVAARIDALPAGEKEVLQTASVLGKVFWADAVAELSGGARSDLDARLRALERKEFVRRERRSSMGGDQQYVFLHALIRDVGYGQLPRPDRAAKHGRAAAWIESLGRPDDHADLIAHHYGTAYELARASGLETTEIRTRARRALRAAGDRAARLAGFRTAMGLYSTALELSDDDDPDRARLLLGLGRARAFTEMTGEEELVAARIRFEADGEVEGAAEAERILSNLFWLRGETGRADEHLHKAVALLEDASPSYAKAEVLLGLSGRLMTSDEFAEAIRVGELALRIAESVGADDARVGALVNIGASRIRATGWESGIGEMRRGVALGRDSRSWQLVRGLGMLRDATFEHGDVADAAELGSEGRRESERLGLDAGLRWLTGEHAIDLYHAGAWDEALGVVDSALTKAGGSWWFEPAVLQVRGDILLARDETSRAVENATRALVLAREGRDPQILYPALAFNAIVAVATGNGTQAASHVDELLELFGARPGQEPRASWVVELAYAMVALGREEAFVAALAPGAGYSRWVEAAIAYASGEVEKALELFALIGSRPNEALARMRAGQILAAESRRAAADEHLRAAATFWRSVGATAYLGQAEVLLAAAS